MPLLLNNDFLDDDDDLPILSSVIKGGNESIIQSSRLDQQALDELEAMRRNTPVRFNLPDTPGLSASESALPAESELDDTQRIDLPLMSPQPDRPSPPELVSRERQEEEEEDDIELLIDELVDRHITELRQDIRTLLDRARCLP